MCYICDYAVRPSSIKVRPLANKSITTVVASFKFKSTEILISSKIKMKSFLSIALIAAIVAAVSCAPQFGFGTSGSAANAGSQSFSQGGFGGFGHHGGGGFSGSAANAGSQSFTQGGGFGPHGHGGFSGSAANAGAQSFSGGAGGFPGFGGFSGSAANAGAQSQTFSG